MADKTDLSQRVAALEQEKQTSEEEFGRQRKKFMHHMMEADEKIKNLQQTLQRTKDELGHFKSTSNSAIQEKESTIVKKATAENSLKQQLESSKKKYEGELANLRHALKVAVDQGESEKTRLERELVKFKSAKRSRSPNLETAMLQAEAETKVLKAVVVPLEQEIETLKTQLKEAHEKLAAAPVTTGEDLIDLSTATTTATSPTGDTSDNVTEVERKLKAEQSARHDMEMHVTTLNSQRVYLQQELEAIHQQLKAAQLDFQKEKTAHDDLKQTWINANQHFLELQAQYEDRIKSLELKSNITSTTDTQSPPNTTSTNPPTTTSVTVENTQEQPDGMYQSTIPIIELSGPQGHKRSMSDGVSALPVPESTSTVENKKSSSLQDVHQGHQDIHQDQDLHQDVTALREEVKRHKEMCANYERQLQRTQQQMTQEMAEKDEAMETMMDTIDKHKTATLTERKKRETLRKMLQKLQDEMKQQVESYQEDEKEIKSTLSSLQENFVRAKQDAQHQVTRMSEERIILTQQTETAREEYECLKAVQSEEMHAQLQKITGAELAQKEAESNVATTFEELTTLQAQLQESENKLSGEIMFLKEQLQSEQNSKDELEATLSSQLSSANQEIAQLLSLNKELIKEKAEAMATSQSIKEKCKQFVENQAKEVEVAQKENHSKDAQIVELKKVIDGLKATQTDDDTQVNS